MRFTSVTHQWLQGEAWDASTPLGPTLVSADEAPDPAALTLRTLVNGEVVQEATTDPMIFPVPTLLSVIRSSRRCSPATSSSPGRPPGSAFAAIPNCSWRR